jgi:hypothetical protein
MFAVITAIAISTTTVAIALLYCCPKVVPVRLSVSFGRNVR